MSSRLALVALALGVLAVAPANAQGAPGNDTFIEATDLVVAGEGQIGGAVATCPAGSRVVSGGVGTTGPAPEGNFSPYVVQLSGPLDSSGLTANTDDGDVARHWYGAVQNIAPSAQLFKVFALCSRTSDAVVEATPFSLPGIGNGGGWPDARLGAAPWVAGWARPGRSAVRSSTGCCSAARVTRRG